MNHQGGNSGAVASGNYQRLLMKMKNN